MINGIRKQSKDNMWVGWLKIVFLYLDGDTQLHLARAVGVMMARVKGIYILIIKVIKLFSFFLLRCFLKEIENMALCFYRVIEALVKVWENLKKLWKHSSVARVPTAFLILPNFHSCFYNSIETRYMFSIS